MNVKCVHYVCSMWVRARRWTGGILTFLLEYKYLRDFGYQWCQVGNLKLGIAAMMFVCLHIKRENVQ